MATRITLAGATVAVCVVAGNAGVKAFQVARSAPGDELLPTDSAASVTTSPTSVAPAPWAVKSVAAPAAAPAVKSASALVASPPAPEIPASPTGPLATTIAKGRTELRDGAVAVRNGDAVTLTFDTPLMRTRRPEKFEQIVRATLPQIYGAAADSLLALVPAGGIASAGDLLTDLPTRGLHLRAPSGWTLDLWPETRPGQDGPLVIAYRASVTH